jgi:hypothetical protein
MVMASILVFKRSSVQNLTMAPKQNNATTTTTSEIVSKPRFQVTPPLYRATLRDPWKRELYARLDRIREVCGELCLLNDKESIDARIVKSSINGTGEKQSFPRLVVSNVDCPAIIGCEEIDDSDDSFPRSIPGELFGYFTLGGMTNYTRFRRFRRNYQEGEGNDPIWTLEDLEREKTKSMLAMPQVSGGYGKESALRVREKLRQLNLTNKSVLVIGSEKPWIEAICLGLGASHVTTLEYGRINSMHPQVQTLTPGDFRDRYQKGTLAEFDVVVSHSSLEHSGLGRYGDSLNPWGDIIAVARAWCVTKSGGSMYLGLPTGKDDIIFNAHRVYGKARWPLMAVNWQQIDGESHTDEEFLIPQGLHVPDGGTGFLFTKR